MRTNIDLDDELLARAAEIAGTKTKKSTDAPMPCQAVR